MRQTQMAARGVALEPVPGLLISVVIHVALFFSLTQLDRAPYRPECGNGKIEPPEVCDDGNVENGDGCSAFCKLELELREVEIEEPEPEPEPKPKPEPEPEPEPEPPPPEPEPKPKPKPEPRPKPKPKPKPKEPPPPPEPAAPPPPPAIELPSDQTITGSNSPVKVIGGDKTQVGKPGGRKGGDPSGKPGGTGKTPGGQGKADQGPPTGPGWAPKGDLYIAQLPRTVKVPVLRCPAVQEMGISGTVVLTVQVRKDGSVRRARVTSGIGNGCDEIAQKALRKSKFKPAQGTDGKPADYELRYEYVFERPR